VDLTADSAAHAASILETLASLYVEKHLEIHKVAGSLPFFREGTVRAAAEVDRAQNALARFDQSHSSVLLDQQKAQKVKNVADLRAAYSEAEAAQKNAQARNGALEQQLNAAPARVTTQSRTVPNQYSTERLNTMLVELRNKRTELLNKYQPTDRMVEEVDQQIAQTIAARDQTRADVSREEATDLNPIRQTLQAELLQSHSRLAGLSGQGQALLSQIEAAQNELNHLSDVTGQHDDLARAVKDAESHYQALSAHLEQTELAEQMDRQRMANVAVAEAPTRNAAPEGRITANVVTATLLGVALVFGIVLVGGTRRRQVFTPWELEGLTGAPVLGAVPLSSARRALPLAATRILEA